MGCEWQARWLLQYDGEGGSGGGDRWIRVSWRSRWQVAVLHVMGRLGDWDRGLAVRLGRPVGEVARWKAGTSISKVWRS